MGDPATLAFYEDRAPFYTASTTQDRHRHLDPFLDRLTPGARILELGCGAGRDAAHMRQRGFHVDATDGTAAMVRKAKERFGVPARQLRFSELDAVSAYDAVYAHASLLHAPRRDLPAVLNSIKQALRPDGWHFANYKLGDGEGRDLLGRLHNFPDREWLLDAYDRAGFVLVMEERYLGAAVDGSQRDWLALTVRKPHA